MNMSLQNTMDTLLLRIQAGFPLIYVVTQEESRVLNNLVKLLRVIQKNNPRKHFIRWSAGLGMEELCLNGGLLPAHNDVDPASVDWLDLEGIPAMGATWNPLAGQEPDDALKRLRSAGEGPGMSANPTLENCLVAIFDVHRLISEENSDLVRPLRATCAELRDYYELHRGQAQAPYKTIIVVGPSAAHLSSELESDVSVIEFPLPEKDELERVLDGMLQRKVIEFPNPIPAEHVHDVLSDRERGTKGKDDVADDGQFGQFYRKRLGEMIANAGRGLSLDAYRLGLNSFAVRDRFLHPEHIETMLNIKADAVAKNPALEYTPHVNVELGGLRDIKEWVNIRLGAVTSDEVRKRYDLPAPKGVLLCGAAGGGKSQLARFMAKAFNLALLRLDVGSLFGSYVGVSEENTRRALTLAESLSPVVLWLDEIDKAFKGSTSGSGDGGVSARVFGYFLTWLADKKDAVFVVATANDFRDLLQRFPEFGRKGRFDLIYWVDLPDAQARSEIFQIYLGRLLKHMPRIDNGKPYLQLDDRTTATLANKEGVPVPDGSSSLVNFCNVLAHNNISLNMTGAEIEAALNDAKYAAFDRDRGRAGFDALTQELILDRVLAAKKNALYQENSPDSDDLKTLRDEAEKRGWLGASRTLATPPETGGQQPRPASLR